MKNLFLYCFKRLISLVRQSPQVYFAFHKTHNLLITVNKAITGFQCLWSWVPKLKVFDSQASSVGIMHIFIQFSGTCNLRNQCVNLRRSQEKVSNPRNLKVNSFWKSNVVCSKQEQYTLVAMKYTKSIFKFNLIIIAIIANSSI